MGTAYKVCEGLRRVLAALLAILSLSLAPAKSSAAVAGSCPQWEAALVKYGLPVKPFSRIMWRESRCIARAIGHNPKPLRDDYGLLQVNGSWVTVTSQVCGTKWGDIRPLLSPACNLKVASYLYRHGGLAHWRATSAK